MLEGRSPPLCWWVHLGCFNPMRVPVLESNSIHTDIALAIQRKRQRGASDGFEDERDAMIRQLTLVMEQERVER